MNILSGLDFQRENGFVLDLGRMRASFVLNRYMFQGGWSGSKVLDTSGETMRAVVEDANVDDAIKALELSEFSDDVKLQDELRQTIWDRRAVFKGLGFFKEATHVIDVQA